MSNTKTVVATPYRKQYADTTVADEGIQNPNDTENTDPKEQDTQSNGDQATSDLSKVDAGYQKRYKDLKSYHDREITAARQRIRDLEEATSQSKLAPPKTEEELADFREQYPEFFDAMMTVSQQQATAETAKLQEELERVRKQMGDVEADRAIAEIQAAHPDYIEVVGSENFKEWLENQDPTIQSWVAENENNSGPFIRALDLFKMDSGVDHTAKGRSKPKSKKKANTDTAADAVNVSGGAVTIGDTEKRIWTTSEIAAMTPDIYAQFEADLDEAAKEGRILKA